MRPFKRVKLLNADEYRVLKKALQSRKIAVSKARRAKIVLQEKGVGMGRTRVAEVLSAEDLRWRKQEVCC